MAITTMAAMVVQTALVLPALAGEPGTPSSGPVRIARDLAGSAIGVSRPVGLAYVPGVGLLTTGPSRTGGTEASWTNVDDESTRPVVADPALGTVNITADSRTGGILVYEATSGDLVSVGHDGRPDGRVKHGLLANGLKHAAGIAVDPSTGALWLLDGRDRTIVRIEPRQASRAGRLRRAVTGRHSTFRPANFAPRHRPIDRPRVRRRGRWDLALRG
jgi:hypothetical protein